MKGEKNLRTESLINSSYFRNGFARNAYNLYYKGKLPIRAGKYKNGGNFIMYDFIYADDNQYIVASTNLINELSKLNVDNNYEYFDYFKGVGLAYFLSKKESKITIVSFSGVSENNEYKIIKKFANSHKNKFDEIILASATGMEIIK